MREEEYIDVEIDVDEVTFQKFHAFVERVGYELACRHIIDIMYKHVRELEELPDETQNP